MPVVNSQANAKHVLVLRPSHQAQNLIDSLTKIGCHPYHFPTIEIVPVPFDLTSAKLDRQDWLVWTSANSVHQTPEWVFEHQGTFIAIGQSTATALISKGVEQVLIPPKGSTSETLVDYLNEYHDPENRKVLILKGVGGRDVLKALFEQKGAIVDQLDVYKRSISTKPNIDVFSQWLKAANKLVWVTSCESFDNLLKLIPSYQINNLLSATIYCASKRIQTFVKGKGGTATICIASPHDKDLCHTLSKLPSILVD